MTMLSEATAKGSRAEQQDRYVRGVLEGSTAGLLLAVMDGHGGERTAQILANDLVETFKTALSGAHAPEQGLKDAISVLADLTEHEKSGSSLSAVFIPADQKTAYIAILGDSPILILDEKGALWTSPLHNARCNLQERQAAFARGARYYRGYLEDPNVPDEGLQLSRSFGDRSLARILSREPEIYNVPLGDVSWVMLATDGVLDSFEVNLEDQFKRLASLMQDGADAPALVEDALRRQTGDNVTVIIWRR